MAKVTIYLLRHGQSIGNLTNTMLGHTDLDLSDIGHKQAQITAEALRNVKFDAVYSSDLIRAKNTALYSAKIHNLEVITDKNFRELFLGDWENGDKNIIKKEQSELFIGGWVEQYGTFKLPNGESTQDGAERFYAALEKIAKKHGGQTILVASHAAIIRAFWGKISAIPPEMWASETEFPTNSSYTVLEYKGGKFIPVSFSNDKHLGEFVTHLSV